MKFDADKLRANAAWLEGYATALEDCKTGRAGDAAKMRYVSEAAKRLANVLDATDKVEAVRNLFEQAYRVDPPK